MNRIIKIYTELDSFYDYRRGLLQWIMTQGISDDVLRKREGERLWEQHMAKNYAERRMDTFEYPALGINRDVFRKAHAERSLTNFLMYYPTNLSRQLVTKVIELEQLTDIPINIGGLVLYVNLFPYEFDEELRQGFIDHCFTLFGGRVEVKTLFEDTSKAEPLYYRQFDYVFKYDILGEDCRAFQDNLLGQPNTNTAFIVPDVLVREVEAFQGPIIDRIFAWSMTMAATVRIVPIAHSFYDFEKTA